jgi:pimeloyl-ACP methyl ester carboxylesterase
MPAVFVHGSPEVAAVWDEIIPHLGRSDVITLSPPGFGAAVPKAFGATADEYRDWLADELSKLRDPIDLVGHDWGGCHVMRIAMDRPDLLRSWAIDVAGGLDPQYVWHDLAQVLQTPGAGEQAITQMLSAPRDARAQRFESLGMSKATAVKIATGFDEEMGVCILALYRSAKQPTLANWGRNLEAAKARPGLVIIATEDNLVGGEAMARRSAARCDATVAALPGSGHWWMSQDPKRGAEALKQFWSGLA